MKQANHFAIDARSRYARFAGVPLRLMIGYGFLMHGLAKLHRGPDTFATILHSLGIPASHPLAWLTIAIEILGGVAFLLGAWIAVVSVPAMIVLIASIVTVHLPFGFSSIKLLGVSNGRPQFGPPGYECALLYIAGIVALALTGPGPWALDSLTRGARTDRAGSATG
jgi:putative oxidoreductase